MTTPLTLLEQAFGSLQFYIVALLLSLMFGASFLGLISALWAAHLVRNQV